MKWKKVVVAAGLLAALSAPCVMAEQWVRVNGNEERVYYFDKDSVEYSPETDTAKVWCSFASPKIKEFTIYQNEINYKTRRIKIIGEETVYKNGGSFPTNYIPANEDTRILPGSIGEEIAEMAAQSVNRDQQLKEYREKQERKERQEKAENAVKKGISLIGGWL